MLCVTLAGFTTRETPWKEKCLHSLREQRLGPLRSPPFSLKRESPRDRRTPPMPASLTAANMQDCRSREPASRSWTRQNYRLLWWPEPASSTQLYDHSRSRELNVSTASPSESDSDSEFRVGPGPLRRWTRTPWASVVQSSGVVSVISPSNGLRRALRLANHGLHRALRLPNLYKLGLAASELLAFLSWQARRPLALSPWRPCDQPTRLAPGRMTRQNASDCSVTV